MRFKYIIRTKEGKRERGFIDSTDEKTATAALRRRGTYVLSLTSQLQTLQIPFLSGERVPKKEQIMFTRQLAVMIKSGLPIVEALSGLEEQTSSKAFQRIINGMVSDLKGGTGIEAAFLKHPNIFPRYYTNVLRAGEKSGKLEEVLLRLADQMENDYQLSSRIRGAMAYPLLILIALVGVVILMLVFVLPQLETIFSDVGADLPFITRAIMALSAFTRKYILILFALAIIGIWALRRLTTTSSGGRLWDRLKLRLPVFGKLFRLICMARFSRTMATLVSAGLPLLDIFETVKDVVGNWVYHDALERISHQVENGVQVSVAMREEKAFPPVITHLMAVGERSGNLDYVLSNIANFFDREVEQMTKNLASLLEPLLMVVMGAGVALVVAAVLMPIYNLVNLQGQ